MPALHPIQEHIDLIARHEQEFLAKRTRSERLGDKIAGLAGSLTFVGFHLLVFAGWICVNTFQIAAIRHFDPPPFSLLGTVVTLEAILLACFILMRQSRISRRNDERDHLMLQILLLTERELTAILDIDRQIARQAGLGKAANSPEAQILSESTSIEDIAESIREILPGTQ